MKHVRKHYRNVTFEHSNILKK